MVLTEHCAHNKRRLYRILKPIEGWAYGRYRAIVGITAEVKGNLQGWISLKGPVVVIKNGVNLIEMDNAKSENCPDFIDPEFFNILMVARFAFTSKDQAALIRAFKILDDKLPFRLFFAGEGPNMSNMRSLVRELSLNDKIQFLGARGDVYSLMGKVDLNVLSTNHEGLSGVALEGLASGKPFLGTDVVGVRDVVPDSTFLFPKGDPHALAERILEVYKSESLRAEMVTKSLAHVKAYDTSIMAEGYVNLYRRLLDGDDLLGGRG